MNNFKEISNEELAMRLPALNPVDELQSMIVNEAGRRLMMMPSIYHAPSDSRPKNGAVIVAFFTEQTSHSGVVLGNYESKTDKIRVNFIKKGQASKYSFNNVEYWCYAHDMAVWVKGVVR